ncbi:MAG TPA: protein kinase [Polyangiaceae bacterium]|nr:protein kinase [Polyangiaceae bacterium]
MEAGQTIAGKYRLNRLLGTGGMASVWSATNVFTEREFAMKFMLPQVARTPEAARRFLLEAKVSARINHPNIIEVIDVGQAEDGSLFLVMELLTGHSLDVVVRRQKPPMPVKEFILFMRDVAQALAAAHRSGVVHRDLKPTNIFLHNDRDGRMVPKILDFGVSKILEEENNTALTVVGTVLGSPLYMSPEQAMGAEGIDGRTDVFAFGAILFEALSGQRAYDAPNFNALIVTIATTQPRPIDEAAPHLPAPLRSLIRDCLVTDKTKRLESFDRIVDRLDEMLPDLLGGDLLLPLTHRGDPEASDAMATSVRRSDRPPPDAGSQAALARAAEASRPASVYPPPDDGGTSSALAEPTVITPPVQNLLNLSQRARLAFRRLSPTTAVVAAGLAGVAVVGLAIGIAAAFTKTDQAGSHAAIEGSVVSATSGATALVPKITPTATPAPPSRPEPSGGVPLISVDSLPVAAMRPTAAPSKGSGRLSVVASPGWCSVSVDGVGKGVTPVQFFDLSVGSHRLDCVAPSGKAKTASVNVADGASAHYRFALDE